MSSGPSLAIGPAPRTRGRQWLLVPGEQFVTQTTGYWSHRLRPWPSLDVLVTDQRIARKGGIGEWWTIYRRHICAIHLHQGPLGRLLGYGDIDVLHDTSGEWARMRFPRLRDVQAVYEAARALISPEAVARSPFVLDWLPDDAPTRRHGYDGTAALLVGWDGQPRCDLGRPGVFWGNGLGKPGYPVPDPAPTSDKVPCSGRAVALGDYGDAVERPEQRRSVLACRAHAGWLRSHGWVDGMVGGTTLAWRDGAWRGTFPETLVASWREAHPNWEATRAELAAEKE